MKETMKEGLASAEAFYRQRDNRTNLVVANLAAYAQREVEIVVDPHSATRPAVQVMALLAANLTARWARNVRVVVPEVALYMHFRRGRYALLSDRITAEMRAADPFGNFRVEESNGKTDGHSLRLLIGDFAHGVASCAEDFVINAAGWSAMGRRGAGVVTASMPPATIAAAGLAAALGVADIFKRAIGHAPAHWLPDYCWSTWSHQLQREPFVEAQAPLVEQLDLGKTLLAGVGAIGSAFVYLADLLPLRGALTLLDRDAVETSNLNRSPLFTATDAQNAVSKTAAAKSYLTAQNLRVETIDGLWREHSARLADHPFDVWISLTNEDAAWAEVPFLLPPVHQIHLVRQSP